MCHPLIAAYVQLGRIIDLNIRPQSPYYLQWNMMIETQREWISELENVV